MLLGLMPMASQRPQRKSQLLRFCNGFGKGQFLCFLMSVDLWRGVGAWVNMAHRRVESSESVSDWI